MAPTWRQRRQAKKTQNMMGGGDLYKPSFAEQRRQKRTEALVDADWAAFDAADAAETKSTDTGISTKEAISRKDRRSSRKGGIDPDAPGTPGQPGFEPQASASDLDDSSRSAVNPLIDPNKSGIPTVEAATDWGSQPVQTDTTKEEAYYAKGGPWEKGVDFATYMNSSSETTAGASGDTPEDFAKEVNELNPTAKTSKFPLTKFINMGDKKTDPADFPNYTYHGGGSYSLKDDGNTTSQQYEGGTRDRSIVNMKNQVDNARNPQHNIISSTGTDVEEIAPEVQDVPNIDTGDDKSSTITSTMPELDTGPGTYQGGGLESESNESTDLTKNASTATTGTDSAGGSGDKKTKKKKGRGLIDKTTDVASSKSSNVSAGSGAGGSTTGYSTRGIPSVFTGNTIA